MQLGVLGLIFGGIQAREWYLEQHWEQGLVAASLRGFGSWRDSDSSVARASPPALDTEPD